MLEIAISATRRRWWGTQSKTWRRWLPQTWEGLQRRRRFVFWSMVLLSGEQALPTIARKVLRLPKWAWKYMDPEDRAAIEGLFDWMQPKYDAEQQPFPMFRHKGVTYIMPKPKFENGCCLEFVLADGYYNKYRTTEDESQLLRLVATLCRPAKEDQEAALLTGDPRIPLFTKAQVEDRAKALKGLHPAIQMSVLLYFAGVKEYVNKTYWMLFEGPKEQEEGEEEQEQESRRGPKFGWWSKFMQVAASGLFGNYEEVLQKRLHLICMHLVDQHEIQEQARLEHARQISKFATNDA